ncbi:MAG: Transposase family [Bacteroidetes bacterium]|nr:Transposase family [Bacteroidota bacterium]
MPNTYSQIYIQIVFAVKLRQNLIIEANRIELQKFIYGITEKRGTKMLAIYCMPDHTHIFVGLPPSVLLSDLVRDIKSASSKFINNKKWVKGKFEWQHGFGAFSYSHSHIDAVVKYILNQAEHHRKRTFREEYVELLRKFEVDHKEEYLFDWI